MLIDLKRFFAGGDASQTLDYSFELREVEVDGVHPFVSPIEVHGTIKAFAGSAELDAELSYDFSMPCNRCMEETLKRCHLKVFHTLVRSAGQDDDAIEVEGDQLDLDELFYSDIILELPVKYICKEDCKGLCPICGKNLNHESCDCGKNQTDPRLEVLKKLINHNEL